MTSACHSGTFSPRASIALLRSVISSLKQSSHKISSVVASNGTSDFFLHFLHFIHQTGCFSRNLFLYSSVQGLHLLGIFCKPLSIKNFCSPAVKTNLLPQSLHISVRSSKSDSLTLFFLDIINPILLLILRLSTRLFFVKVNLDE